MIASQFCSFYMNIFDEHSSGQHDNIFCALIMGFLHRCETVFDRVINRLSVFKGLMNEDFTLKLKLLLLVFVLMMVFTDNGMLLLVLRLVLV